MSNRRSRDRARAFVDVNVKAIDNIWAIPNGLWLGAERRTD
jgi:hypothetical protein